MDPAARAGLLCLWPLPAGGGRPGHLRAAIPGGQLAFEFRLPREFTLEPRKSAVMQTIVRVLSETAGPGDFGCAANEAGGVWGLFIRPDAPAQ